MGMTTGNDGKERGYAVEDTQEHRDQLTADRFVTYKWLIATALTMMGIVILVVSALSISITASINSKVNSELYNANYKVLCSDVDEIKRTVEANQKSMIQFNANQILVMRALKIEPVK